MLDLHRAAHMLENIMCDEDLDFKTVAVEIVYDEETDTCGWKVMCFQKQPHEQKGLPSYVIHNEYEYAVLLKGAGE